MVLGSSFNVMAGLTERLVALYRAEHPNCVIFPGRKPGLRVDDGLYVVHPDVLSSELSLAGGTAVYTGSYACVL